MRDDSSSALYCTKPGFTYEAEGLLRLIREHDSKRTIQDHMGNVTTRYVSRKMPFIVESESHKVELHGMEADADVLEYYDQPSTIKLVCLWVGFNPMHPLGITSCFVHPTRRR